MGVSCVVALGLLTLEYINIKHCVDRSGISAIGGCVPEKMGLGPVYAIEDMFSRIAMESSIDYVCSGSLDYNLDDIDVIETNEAFASVVLAQNQQLVLDRKYGHFPVEKVNRNGGAIALGHPISASGARLVLTCAKELELTGGTIGLVTLCVGGGQGVAACLERSK